MASIFWYADRILFIDYLEKGKTINSITGSIARRNQEKTALQSVQKERVLDFSKTIRDFWTFFFLMKVHSKDYGVITKVIQ